MSNRKHGMTHTPTYRSWRAMKDRCTKLDHKDYPRWGARGIKVCDRWLYSFENFYKDMGDRPKGKSLDRINNEGNYEPSNCRWATPMEQSNNTTQNHNLIRDGVIMSVSKWSRTMGVSRRQIYNGLSQGLFTEV